MHFRAPHEALKQRNDHNFPNVQLITRFVQGLLPFMKPHLLAIFSKQWNVF